MPSSFDSNSDFANEKALHKVFRKIKEEPLIPLGMALTTAAFVNAYLALRRGDSRQANRMFRARVGAQGFTVIAMVAGSMYYSKDREKTAELRKLQSQRDSEEKRRKWIRELEVRDEEEKILKQSLKDKVHAAEARLAEDKAKAEGGSGSSDGGIIGKMGLWSQGEKKAVEQAEAQKAEDLSTDKKSRRENPKSSLGAIGEIMTTQKKDDGKKSD